MVECLCRVIRCECFPLRPALSLWIEERTCLMRQPTRVLARGWRWAEGSKKTLVFKKKLQRSYTLHRSCVMESQCKQRSATLSLSHLSLALSLAVSTGGGQRVRHTRATLGSDAAAGVQFQGKHAANASYPLTRHGAAGPRRQSGSRSLAWRYAANASDASRCEQRAAHMHRQKSGLRSFCRWGFANRGCELGSLRPSPAGLKAASVWLVKRGNGRLWRRLARGPEAVAGHSVGQSLPWERRASQSFEVRPEEARELTSGTARAAIRTCCSAVRSNSTVTQIEAVPGPSLFPGRVHLTHLVRVRVRVRFRFRFRFRFRLRFRVRVRARVRALLHLTTHVSRNWPVRRFEARSQSPSKLSSPSPREGLGLGFGQGQGLGLGRGLRGVHLSCHWPR